MPPEPAALKPAEADSMLQTCQNLLAWTEHLDQSIKFKRVLARRLSQVRWYDKKTFTFSNGSSMLLSDIRKRFELLDTVVRRQLDILERLSKIGFRVSSLPDVDPDVKAALWAFRDSRADFREKTSRRSSLPKFKLGDTEFKAELEKLFVQDLLQLQLQVLSELSIAGIKKFSFIVEAEDQAWSQVFEQIGGKEYVEEILSRYERYLQGNKLERLRRLANDATSSFGRLAAGVTLFIEVLISTGCGGAKPEPPPKPTIEMVEPAPQMQPAPVVVEIPPQKAQPQQENVRRPDMKAVTQSEEYKELVRIYRETGRIDVNLLIKVFLRAEYENSLPSRRGSLSTFEKFYEIWNDFIASLKGKLVDRMDTGHNKDKAYEILQIRAYNGSYANVVDVLVTRKLQCDSGTKVVMLFTLKLLVPNFEQNNHVSLIIEEPGHVLPGVYYHGQIAGFESTMHGRALKWYGANKNEIKVPILAIRAENSLFSDVLLSCGEKDMAEEVLKKGIVVDTRHLWKGDTGSGGVTPQGGMDSLSSFGDAHQPEGDFEMGRAESINPNQPGSGLYQGSGKAESPPLPGETSGAGGSGKAKTHGAPIENFIVGDSGQPEGSREDIEKSRPPVVNERVGGLYGTYPSQVLIKKSISIVFFAQAYGDTPGCPKDFKLQDFENNPRRNDPSETWGIFSSDRLSKYGLRQYKIDVYKNGNYQYTFYTLDYRSLGISNIRTFTVGGTDIGPYYIKDGNKVPFSINEQELPLRKFQGSWY